MKNFFLFLLSIALLSACKKDSDNQPSKTDLLTAKKWRLTVQTQTYTARGGGVTADNITDVYASTAACTRDDFDKYNTDNTIVTDEGATKCSPSLPQSRSFTWAFNPDQTKLLDAPNSPASSGLDIVELSATTLHLRKTDVSTGGSTTYTFIDDLIYTAF